MKYAILVGDGMADFSLPELDNRTPLEYAATPSMDAVARAGRVGLVKTIPDGLSPGSDVAKHVAHGIRSGGLLFRPRAHRSREHGIKLKNTDVAFRCNLVTSSAGLWSTILPATSKRPTRTRSSLLCKKNSARRR